MDPTGVTTTGEDQGEEPNDVFNIDGLTDLNAPFAPDENSPNLVYDYMEHPEGRAALKRQTEDVLTTFETDWDSNAEYREKTAQILALLNGYLPKKSFPWQDSANAHVPILLENTLRLESRIEIDLFGDWSNVYGAVGVDPSSDDEAELVTLHLNWQCREDIPDFKRQARRALMGLLAIGDCCVDTFWDPERQQNRVETLTPDEFVTPFSFVSTMPDYSDLPHYTKVLRYYRHQVEARRDEWYDVDAILDKTTPNWDEVETPIADAVADVYGQDKSDDIMKGAPYVFLEYEGWLKLPNQKRDRFCRFVVDYCSKRPVMLRIHEEGDWRDIERYNRQAAELEAYKAAVAQHQMMSEQAMQQGMQLAGQAGQGAPEYTQELAARAMEAVPELVGPPPPAPDWVDPEDPNPAPAPVRRIPIFMKAHGVCFEPMAGGLGFGPGRVLVEYNKAANTALSQYTDAATLANASGLIVADVVDFDRPFTWSPGKINKAKCSSAELQSAIMPMKAAPPSAELIQVVNLMMQSGQAAAQSPEVLGGAPGKSGETYRGIATRVEQATKQLSVIGRTCADLVRQVGQNLAKLNSVFLPDDQIMRLTQWAAATMAGPLPPVTKEMYRRNYRIEIRADLQFKADAERVAEADEILAMVLKIPVLAQDAPMVHAAARGSFEARHRRDMVALLGPAPKPTGFPFNWMPPPMMGGQPQAPQNPAGGPSTNGGQKQNGGSPPRQPMGPGAPPPNNPQGPGGPAPGPPPPGPANA